MDYMRRNGNRTIKVNKAELIKKIEENKKNHQKSYKKAVTAYKREALKQLKTLTKDVRDGDLSISLDLTSPINNEENYDKIIDMFKWDVNEEVELDQNEFNEYVQDETEFARMAHFQNSLYVAG
jgi:hypothetical protein